jgi:hypothetical protein
VLHQVEHGSCHPCSSRASHELAAGKGRVGSAQVVEPGFTPVVGGGTWGVTFAVVWELPERTRPCGTTFLGARKVPRRDSTALFSLNRNGNVLLHPEGAVLHPHWPLSAPCSSVKHNPDPWWPFPTDFERGKRQATSAPGYLATSLPRHVSGSRPGASALKRRATGASHVRIDCRGGRFRPSPARGRRRS